MFGRQGKLEKLQRRLAKQFGGDERPDIRLLTPEQLVIRKHMTANPIAEKGLKAAAMIPDENGYEIYVSLRPKENAASSTQSLLTPQPQKWDAVTTNIALEPTDLTKYWQLLLNNKTEVTIRVRCGSEATIPEANRILTTISQVIL
jgi:hypothetical protein